MFKIIFNADSLLLQQIKPLIKCRGIASNIYFPHVFNNIYKCLGISMINRHNSYYQYDSKLEELVNRQICAEHQAAQNYLSMAITFLHPSVARPGAGGYFMKMYKEELEHMMNFINYQILRGGIPLLGVLKAPAKYKDLKLLDSFNQALCMEKEITKLLEEVASTAGDVKDYQCADFITSIFLVEQMQAINEITNHITKLTRLGDDEDAVYHYDFLLAKEHPYKLKYHSDKGLKY